MKIRLVGAKLFHADRYDEVVVAFRHFANAPKSHMAWSVLRLLMEKKAAGNGGVVCAE
jgi:hypothetical protein